ncbi:MAG: 2-C-methyl-D-erythritol 4-phosphate cytidylyltransferase [Lachnospiraceae bacterium]|nr:2-C-methyl-D-erythritol 4-phosphate cytidylyltransferase [Lachnospiraceae bacterium]
MNTVLLMMGGTGTRMGADRPKQYLEINGKPVFYYIVRRYAKVEEVSAICIVSHGDWIDYVREAISDIDPGTKNILVTQGGDNRSQSVRNGLKAIKPFSGDSDVILIHDATHPYVDAEGTRGIIDAVNESGAATLGARQYDTCYRINSDMDLVSVIPREELVSGASPEAFRFGDLYGIYMGSTDEELAAMTSAGAMALAHGIHMRVIPANVLNLKLTYPGDFELLKVLLDTYFFPAE